jgi:hypothetical protein
MTDHPDDVAYSDSIRAIQQRLGSRGINERMAEERAERTTVTAELAAFIARMDMLYLGTASLAGQPYIQYRGGPVGFLKVVDERTLGFADYAGNRQYISLGNLAENPRAFIFLMDYINSRRVKLWGSARVVYDDPALLARLADPGYAGVPERAILFTIAAWDPNCPRHIHARYPAVVVAPLIQQLQQRVADLEQRLRAAGLEVPEPRG